MSDNMLKKDRKTFPMPKLTTQEWASYVKQIISKGWLVESYDSFTAKSVYRMTDDGAKYYTLTSVLLNRVKIFNGPTIKPQTTIQVDTSLANPDIRLLYDDGFIAKTVSKYGETKIEFTEHGAKWFYAFTSMIDRPRIPIASGDKIAKGLYKTTKIMAGITDFMQQLSQPYTRDPPYAPKTNRPKASHRPPKPQRQEDLSYRLSSFPNPKRNDWMDI